MTTLAKIIAGLTASALFTGSALAGPLKFSGNASVPSEDLYGVTVLLKEGEGGLVPDPLGRTYQLRNIDATQLAPISISAILRGISELYQERGILATRAVVTAPGYKASLEGKPLEVKIIEGKITKTRIVGTANDQVVSPAKKARIMSAAPIGVGQSISAKALDGTVGLMNRFSRQQVRPVLVPEQGDLVLEYRVKQLDESITTLAMDNYGAERLGRERFTLDYTNWNTFTPDDKFHFKALSTLEGNSNYFGADYMLPLDNIASSRLAFNVAYSNFVAEDVGLVGATGIDFEGNSFNLGVSWEKTLWNDTGQYLESILGLRYLDVTQDQTSIGVPKASTGFLLPSAGLRYSRTTPNSSLIMGGRIEFNLSSLANTDSGTDLDQQGRLFAEDSFVTGSIYAAYRRYLDEVFTGKDGRDHEFSAFVTANTSFGDRLPPSFLNVAGGFPTVRGYPLGVASGDSSFMVKLDYKYHFDTLDVGGVPLDLSATLFSDFATVKNEDALFFEGDETLWSVGLGLDAKVNEDLRATTGYGFALSDIDSPVQEVEAGDGEFYFQIGYSF
jgi:hemolysin activation/secretion protein